MENKIDKTFDIVFCIDATSEMAGYLELIGQNSLKLLDMIHRSAAGHSRSLRLKIIIYKDYMIDGEEAILMTDFLDYPQELTNIQSLFSEIEPSSKSRLGNGLEALAYAIRTEWGKDSVPVIVLWANHGSQILAYGSSADYYDKQLPRFFSKLTRWWKNSSYVNQQAKRLIMFTADEHPWSQIQGVWNNSVRISFDHAVDKDFPAAEECRPLLTLFYE